MRSSVRESGRAALARLGGLANRRSLIVVIAGGWVVATGAVAALARPEPVVVLVLLAIGMIVVSTMHVHRQHRVLLGQLTGGLRRDRPDGWGEPGSPPTDEILDRLKLSALTLGRIAEDLTASTASVKQAVVDESGRLARQLTSLQNLHALIPVEAPVPYAMACRDSSPELALWLVEALRTDRPELVVGCGGGPATLWAALAVRRFDLDAGIVVLEHDPAAVGATETMLASHGVADLVEVRTAPLEPIAGGELVYAHQAWADLTTIGLLFIDGPGGVPFAAAALLAERAAAGVVIVADPEMADRLQEARPGRPTAHHCGTADA